VLSVSCSLFGAGVSVWVCVHTHTVETAHGVLDVSSGVGTRHLEGPKNPDELNLGMYIRAHKPSSKLPDYFLRLNRSNFNQLVVFVYKIHVYIYAGRRESTALSR